ncbi:MAG: hypothetical protein HY231_22325 [Acidobacteria bacterium]|nr:hypothetical protein [Acidobacteriota bacterium]
MIKSDDKYNLRQYELMLTMIQRYQGGLIKLPQLVDDLDALNTTLHNPSDSWLSEFEPAWGQLEDVLAFMLDEGRSQLDDTEHKLIEDALIKLTLLIESNVAKTQSEQTSKNN